MGQIRGDLTKRALAFAAEVLEIVDQLPSNNKGWELTRQIVRSSGSIGANLWEADHAFSRSDFAHMCSIALKEAAETHFWLLLCLRASLIRGVKVQKLIDEADELTRILTTIVNTTQNPRSASVNEAHVASQP
jgi:four helix bundle protein